MGAPSPAGRTLLEKTSAAENLRPTAYSLSASLNEGRGPRGVRAKEVALCTAEGTAGAARWMKGSWVCNDVAAGVPVESRVATYAPWP
jgi:hypothetical protein